MLNYCKGNEFDLHNNFATHFHLNGCAPELALKLRHAATRKWAINQIPPKSMKVEFEQRKLPIILFHATEGNVRNKQTTTNKRSHLKQY